MKTFFPFSFLPIELRHHIYSLATPPRVVEVTSVEEEEVDFWERWAADPLTGLYVHPDITYYLKLWNHADIRNGLQWRKQSTLTSYGFSTQKPQHGHWPAEKHFPLEAILSKRKKTVYSMFRHCELYSDTPIPALLHACVDSRTALMSMGYELAFSTRTQDARTWFNFRTDILYISGDMEVEYGSFLGGCDSDTPVGQFRPQDLRRIRRLVFSRHLDLYFPRSQIDRLCDICHLMPNLQQIYLDADGWEMDTYVYPPDFQKLLKPYLKAIARLPSTRSWEFKYLMPYEDIDSLFSDFLGYTFTLPDDPHAGGLSMYTWLMIWREAHGHGSSFIEAFEARMRALLQERIDQDHRIRTEQDISCGRQLAIKHAPQIHAVHVSPIEELQKTYYFRQALRLYFKDAVGKVDREPAGAQVPLVDQATHGGIPLSWPETLRTGTPPLGPRPDWNARLQWWVKRGLPDLRCPGFDAFP